MSSRIPTFLAGAVVLAVATGRCIAADRGSSAGAFAAPAAASATATPSLTGLSQVGLSLMLVLAAIFGLAWVARRFRVGQRVGETRIQILSDVSLGNRERAVLVRVCGTQLLIGVAPGMLRTLHVLPTEPSDAPAEPAAVVSADSPLPRQAALSFREVLMKGLGR